MPAIEFAIAVTVAKPLVVVVAGEPVIEAEAPLAAGVNVTVAPDTTFPFASLTIATRGAPKPVLIAALWLLPVLTVTVAAAPAALVRAKVAGVATLATDAVTL